MVAAWAAGLVLRDLGSLTLQLRATNDVLAGQAHWLAEHAIVAERRRIARDLHDELGHTLTVVALQACAARRMAATDPARAREIVRTLAQVAHDGALALGDDGVLARGDEGPTPGLADLLTRTRAAGTDVSGEVADVVCLSEEGRAVVYRLVQESLTNVLRHAPGARASVVVRRHEDQVEISVTNTAPTRNPGPAGSGRGLTGICERVTACAGEVSWGPDADGGFTVLARLPMAMELT
jgi:signal transduction histidine kinase